MEVGPRTISGRQHAIAVMLTCAWNIASSSSLLFFSYSLFDVLGLLCDVSHLLARYHPFAPLLLPPTPQEDLGVYADVRAAAAAVDVFRRRAMLQDT